MSEHKRRQIPIGYWLKRADELLTKRIDEAQRSNGLTRLGWQALNVLRERRAARHDEIVDTLQPFADAAMVDDVVGGLVQRGLVSSSTEDGFNLTPVGTELYERALLAQQVVRQRAVAGISETEYATMVGALQRLVENLERDDAA
jgi:DNA-binding MarR family transcriptional regulator